MKNIARAFVLAITLTGSAAYTQIVMHAGTTVSPKTNSMPVPCCPPKDPSACGMR